MNCPTIGPGCPTDCLDCIPRAHFDQLTWGLVTCFQILSGENWNTVMYDGMLAYRNIDGKNYEYVAILYFFGLVVFGQLIILNLFLAVLMSNFDEASSKIRKEEAEKRKEKQEARRKTTTETGRASLSQRASLSMQRSGTDFYGTITKSDGVRRRLEDCNLGLFGPDNPIRKWCEALIKSKGTFSMEMLLKKIAFGAVIGKVTENGPYWRKPWNILDGGVVIIAVIDTLGIGQEYSAIKTLRVLRALRPLRVISRNPNLKLVVNTLFKSVPELCNLLVVAGLFLLIIGLFSVTYFKGKLFTCKAPIPYELDDFDMDLSAVVSGIGVMPLCIDINKDSPSFGHLWPQGNVSDGEFVFGNAPCVQPGDLEYWSAYSEVATLPRPPVGAILRPWQRQSEDTPVCDAGCPTGEADGLWASGGFCVGKDCGRPKICPALLTMEDIPSVCYPDGLNVAPETQGDYFSSPWVAVGSRWLQPCAAVDVMDEDENIVRVDGCGRHG